MLPRIAARLTILASLILALPVSAGDWPRFRGPNGTGISDDKNIPVQWTEKDITWKVPIPGLGNGSPIVSKDRVFVHTAAADGSTRSLICLEAATGKTLWTKTIPANKAPINHLNSLASSTPAADGERVFVAFWSGDK